MAKLINRLSAQAVKKQKKPGWYNDGNGLYLQVSKSGSKSFVFRYKINGKERRHGLGSFPSHSLDDARSEAIACRKLLKKDIDPIERKKELELAKKIKKSKSVTFRDCAVAYIDLKKSGWKNRKHESQWSNTLKTYAYPIIGDLPVSMIDVELIEEVLRPIWNTKNETADRVRQRIGRVLDYAKVKKYRTGDNPAEWKGNLSEIFPKPTDV